MDVTIPELPESITEGDLGRWLKAEGELIQRDEPLLEIETDKTTLEIPAAASGRLSILKAAGETVTSGDVVGRIDESAGEEAEPAQEAAPPSPKDSSAEAATEAEEERPAASPPTKQGPSPQRTRAPKEPQPAEPREAAPAEARTARATGRDVPARARPATPAKPAAPRATRPDEPATARATRPDEPGTRRERMSRLRRSIAERLVAAQHAAAILTTFNEVDMSSAIAMRKQNQEHFLARHGVKLGYVSLFGRALIAALKQNPALNAFIEGDEILYHDHVHLGVAVGTDRGLVVPVVRHADRLSLGELEREIQRLAVKARDGEIELSDLQGGTFTISNGGVYGSMLSTPILNPPQSGILGLHAIEPRAKVLPDGSIAARPMMFLALSYDHRIVDGKEAVTFLVRVKELIEDPERMLLEA